MTHTSIEVTRMSSFGGISMFTVGKEHVTQIARVLLAFHRRRGRELAERHGLDYPVELDRLVSAKLEQVDSQ